MDDLAEGIGTSGAAHTAWGWNTPAPVSISTMKWPKRSDSSRLWRGADDRQIT
jgi:hypothetical protein